MPPRNTPLPNAVNLFNCTICDKGYPRQTDYENHLRSYDHNHRQRLADMKKLTDASASDATPRLSKGPLDMRSIPQAADAGKKGLGPRFKKVGGVGAAGSTGGTRFKKVGAAVEEGKEDGKGRKEEAKEASAKIEAVAAAKEEKPAAVEAKIETQPEAKKDEDMDVVMADGDDDGDEAITWEEYDFTKPSECDHVNCSGCAMPANLVYEDGWLVLSSA